jgi:hypothetical protein
VVYVDDKKMEKKKLKVKDCENEKEMEKLK